MITARITKEWTDTSEDGSVEATTYELSVDAGYNPDICQDLMNRVVSAVAADRKEAHELFAGDDD